MLRSRPESTEIPVVLRLLSTHDEHIRMSEKSSFATRAAVAVGLMIGFYALALGLIGLLLLALYAQVAFFGRINIYLTIGCLVAVFAIVRSVFFIGESFEAPGPEIVEAEQPELVGAIRSVAGEMGASMPQHIYVIPEVNAFVAEVGGWMGIVGTSRVMAIGVGLLNVDSVSQLKATVAHEFGHYHGGDTKLGGFLYRTRGSLARALEQLDNDESLVMVLAAKPFEWYGEWFLDLTRGISRAQELSADAFSVRVAGKQAHIDGLRREAGCGALFGAFLDEEVAPLINNGLRPENIYDGFRTYVANLDEDGAVEAVTATIAKAKTNPHDTHPSLADRVAFAEGLPEPNVIDEPGLARELLVDAEVVERKMTDRLLDNALGEKRQTLTEVTWEAGLREVVARRMDAASAALGAVLGDRDRGGVEGLFEVARQSDRHEFARRISPGTFRAGGGSLAELTDGVYRMVMAARLGSTLVAEHGYTWEPEPGRHHQLRAPSGELVNLDRHVAARASEEEIDASLRAFGIARGSSPAE